jgi:hypothetical protein
LAVALLPAATAGQLEPYKEMAAVAQGGPDFSGRWTAVPEPLPAAGSGGGSGTAALAGTMGSGWGATLTIEQRASALVVERAQFSQYDMQPPMRLTYALDGSESRNTINMGRGPQELVSKAAWEQTSLAITTSFRFSNPRSGAVETSDLKQVLSLDPSGSLVVTTTLGGALGGPASTTSTTYKKGS